MGLVMCGQELSPESYAIRKADDPGSDVANIVFGNTLSISRRDVPGIHDRPAPERDALTVLTALVSSRGRRVAALHVLVPQPETCVGVPFESPPRSPPTTMVAVARITSQIQEPQANEIGFLTVSIGHPFASRGPTILRALASLTHFWPESSRRRNGELFGRFA